MSLKYKNSSGEWVQVPIPSEINDITVSTTTTYSSEKVEAEIKNKQDKLTNEQITKLNSNLATESYVDNAIATAITSVLKGAS